MLTFDAVRISQGDFHLSADWSVSAGQRVAIIGPSGGGKSTLMLAIAGFLPLQTGKISWCGQDLAPLTPGDRPLSLLFQDQNLFAHLTVAQNLGLGLNPSLRLTPEQHASVTRALSRVGLNGMNGRKPGSLSGGQQSRTALARALLRARPMLLLDEPFAALGPAMKAEMLQLVTHVANETGVTVLMVTHDPGDAMRFADQTVLVAGGIAHPPKATAQLFANPPDDLVAYLGQ